MHKNLLTCVIKYGKKFSVVKICLIDHAFKKSPLISLWVVFVFSTSSHLPEVWDFENSTILIASNGALFWAEIPGSLIGVIAPNIPHCHWDYFTFIFHFFQAVLFFFFFLLSDAISCHHHYFLHFVCYHGIWLVPYLQKNYISILPTFLKTTLL